MARIYEPTPDDLAEWDNWLKDRPEKIRAVAQRIQPWDLYRIKETNQRVHVIAYGEDEEGDVSLRVLVSGKYNFVMFERQVFGIKPDDIEPCELPADGEMVGVVLTTNDAIDEYIKSKLGEFDAANDSQPEVSG